MENGDDIAKSFKTIRLKYTQNRQRLTYTLLGIDQLMNLVALNIDGLMISETKIDESFPISQFLIDSFI